MKFLVLILISSSVLAFNCKKGFLCGNGCGLHEAEADGAARAQIAKMFKVKVTSTFTSARANFGEFDEAYVHEVIDEYVSESLEGITIENRKEEEGVMCATAVLNKINFSENIKNKIRALNKQSKTLVVSGNKLIWEMVRANNSKVQQLGSLLSVVEVDSVSKPIAVPVLKNEPVEINFEGSENIDVFKGLLISRIKRNGYEEGKAKKKIKVNLTLEKLPLNISGFVKYRLIVDMKSFKGKKNVSRAFSKLIASGRSIEQVSEKLYAKFKNELPNYFVDLKL